MTKQEASSVIAFIKVLPRRGTHSYECCRTINDRQFKDYEQAVNSLITEAPAQEVNNDQAKAEARLEARKDIINKLNSTLNPEKLADYILELIDDAYDKGYSNGVYCGNQD